VTNITTNEVDDGFNLHLTFESGKRATVEVGTYNFLPLPRFYMQAKNGTAIIDDWQKKCRIAKLKAWCEKEVLPVQTAAGITKTMAPRDEITLDFYEIERPTSDVHDYYRNLVKAIDGKEEIFVKLTEVRRVLLVMEAAFESADKKEALKTNI
jgi:predicted dehydrogenase